MSWPGLLHCRRHLSGHPNHPEVISVSSFAQGKCVVIESPDQVEPLVKSGRIQLPCGVISQTTLRKEIYLIDFPKQIVRLNVVLYPEKLFDIDAIEMSKNQLATDILESLGKSFLSFKDLSKE